MPTNLPKVPVLCIAQDQAGAPLAGGKFEARLDRLETYNGFVVPEITTGIADADGACVLNLWPNSFGAAGSTYRVRAWSAEGKRYLDGYASVPDAPCALQDILIAVQPPELDMATTAAAQARAALALAIAAADRAEAAAGGGGGGGGVGVGPKGDKGDKGDPGSAGPAGPTIKTGAGTPPGSSGIGDLYVDTITGDLYQWTA